MIRCPACGALTTVKETRDVVTSTYVRRRRICSVTTCGTKVTTAEFILPDAAKNYTGDLVIVRHQELERLAKASAQLVASAHPLPLETELPTTGDPGT